MAEGGPTSGTWFQLDGATRGNFIVAIYERMQGRLDQYRTFASAAAASLLVFLVAVDGFMFENIVKPALSHSLGIGHNTVSEGLLSFSDVESRFRIALMALLIIVQLLVFLFTLKFARHLKDSFFELSMVVVAIDEANGNFEWGKWIVGRRLFPKSFGDNHRSRGDRRRRPARTRSVARFARALATKLIQKVSRKKAPGTDNARPTRDDSIIDSENERRGWDDPIITYARALVIYLAWIQALLNISAVCVAFRPDLVSLPYIGSWL